MTPPPSPDTHFVRGSGAAGRAVGLWVYLVAGILFGIVITKAEVVSWFRIQEMFRFQGFHMFGIFATAVPTAILTVQAMKRFGARTRQGERVAVPPKEMQTGTRYWLGGTIFGVGWALTGACPGPMFALLGSGIGVVGLILVSAMLGTWMYGLMRSHLPH